MTDEHEEAKPWRCKYCGHDRDWFDRSVSVWTDDKGIQHEDGPHYRCASCGKIAD